MAIFGQIVIGPPGAGKTSYCYGMEQITAHIERKTILINLDFANDSVPYNPTIDVRSFLSLQTAMESYNLGPNGGLIFCMESLLSNIEWLEEKLQRLIEENEGESYVIIDCPGQIELYTHHNTVQEIINRLSRDFDLRLCSVYLLDSFYCSQPAVFISACLLAINTMLRLGLPHINVLSKVDLLHHYGPLPFTLDFYTELLDLTPILRYLDKGILESTDTLSEYDDSEEEEKGEGNAETKDPGQSKLQQKFHAMTSALCEVVNDFGLVSFLPMNIEDIPTVARVLAATDKANGMSMAEAYREYESNKSADPLKRSTPKSLFHYASEQLESLHEISLEIQEKYSTPQRPIPPPTDPPDL